MTARPVIGALVATAAIGAFPASAPAADRGAVVHWNVITQREIVPPAPAPAVPPPAATTPLASVQLAVYNAVVAIEGG
jgi:hypothetical protein